MAHRRVFVFTLILLAYLAAGGLYAALTPPWQAPDEPAHYNYVRYVAAHRSFPELVAGCYNQAYLSELTTRNFPPQLSIDSICYEFHQPPLYYLLAAGVFAASGGSLLALRLFSVGLGAGVAALAFFIGRLLFPNRAEIAAGAMALVAFVPMHVAMLASVNNDALAELVLAGLLLLLCRRLLLPGPPSTRNDLLLGGLLGVGLVTKATVYIAILLVAATLWMAAGPNRQRLARQAVTVFGAALVIALPWYGRNAALYGNFDVLGLQRHNAVVVGQLRTADFLANSGWTTYARNLVTTTFHSFWGQFGWMAVPMDSRTYFLLVVLTILALAGLVAWLPGSRSLPAGHQRALALLALAILLVVMAYGGYNITFVQFQGRYLFPALIPVSLFFTLGLAEIFSPPRRWWPVAGLGIALVWLAGTGLAAGNPDKWAILIVGLGLALAVIRAWLFRQKTEAGVWLVATCYLGVGLLALLGPFWFVTPYLWP